MNEENTLIITKYVGVWGWMILSINFLIATFLMFSLPRTNLTIIFSVAFFLIFGATQFIATKRRRELEDVQNNWFLSSSDCLICFLLDICICSFFSSRSSFLCLRRHHTRFISLGDNSKEEGWTIKVQDCLHIFSGLLLE